MNFHIVLYPSSWKTLNAEGKWCSITLPILSFFKTEKGTLLKGVNFDFSGSKPYHKCTCQNPCAGYDSPYACQETNSTALRIAKTSLNLGHSECILVKS